MLTKEDVYKTIDAVNDDTNYQFPSLSADILQKIFNYILANIDEFIECYEEAEIEYEE